MKVERYFRNINWIIFSKGLNPYDCAAILRIPGLELVFISV